MPYVCSGTTACIDLAISHSLLYSTQGDYGSAGVVYMYETSFNCIIIVIITFNIYQY